LILAYPVNQLQLQPFRYSVVPKALRPELGGAVLDWLEGDAPWSLKIAEFYEQHELTITNEVLPANLRDDFSEASLRTLRDYVSTVFQVQLGARIDVTAHRLTEGQRIRIHNDYIPGRETHRLLIQLNRGWSDENGGALMLFGSGGATEVHQILRPVHNSGLLFEISQRSLHAVTPIRSGERYTLVFSFFS
jgi:Rps23 Pro-64 3,4-dihydroxylase Tpa1-like proline 4-hydroxylase